MKVSRSGYYTWLNNCDNDNASSKQKREINILTECWFDSKKTYGYRRLIKECAKNDLIIGQRKILAYKKALGLKIKAKSDNPYSNFKKSKEHISCPNILCRNFAPLVPNQVWTGDITYIRTKTGWVYLAVVIDLFSRMVVGWSISLHPNTELVLKALSIAIFKRKPARNTLIFHSDQGCQYTSKNFVEYCKLMGLIQSMSRRGQCWDNAPTESFFGTMKQEESITRNKPKFEGLEDAEKFVFEYIEVWYNLKRIHSYIGYSSPANYENNLTA